ncbi:hypothetical protein ANAPRD1_00361 [Anaplasma phagocytophilum]|nr:hypothetical protein ANAPRD1_00361 [Anaplasma phagocytophilum]
MMLLLDRLINLLLLLPRLLGRTSFSLLRRLGFLILILIRRFVGRDQVAAPAGSMGCMLVRRKTKVVEVKGTR